MSNRLYDQLKGKASAFLDEAAINFKTPFKASEKLKPSERFLSHWLVARHIPSKQIQAALQLMQHSKRLGKWQYQFAQIVEKEGWLTGEELAKSESQIQALHDNIPMLVIHICECWRLVKSPERLIKDLHADAATSIKAANPGTVSSDNQDYSLKQAVIQTLKQRLLNIGLHQRKVDYVFKIAQDLSEEISSQLVEEQPVKKSHA